MEQEKVILTYEAWSRIGISVGAMIVGIFIAINLFRYLVESYKIYRINRSYTSPKTLSTNRLVHERLSEIRFLTGACRAFICHFHNGGRFLDGISIKKFSITHESFDPDLSPVHQTKQDFLLSLYPDMIHHLTKNTPEIFTIEEIPESYWKRIILGRNSDTASYMPIYNNLGTIVTGFLAVEWCGYEDLETKTTHEDEIKEHRNLIQTLLNRDNSK